MPRPQTTPSSPAAAGLPVSRRALLGLAGVTGTVLALGIDAPGATAAPVGDLPDGLFALGVASGAPRHDGLVLWTRLAPDPMAEDGHGGMARGAVGVKWEVATDESFDTVVADGEALATAELAHTVHPRVKGLDPSTAYFYRFTVGDQTSPVGRFTTLPAPGEIPESFSFATASCQAWYHGHFTAHKHLAQEEDLDLVVFLGDYIYEYGITEANLWRQGVEVAEPHTVTIETLEQYRLRYGLFKSDPHLQAVHRRAPAIAVWDDHEVENNYGGKVSTTGISDELFVHRMAVAYRAFYEHMPLEVSAIPDGPESHISAGVDVGGLARFSLLDCRQFRDPAPTSDEDQQSEDRTILGAEQEAWVTERLEESDALWNILGNGVVFTAVTDDRTEMWDGYPANRRRVLASMGRSRNAVMLSGDIHRHVASELKADFDDPDGPNVGVELVCSSIASNGDTEKEDGLQDDWLAHDYVKMYDGRRGYVHVTLTPDAMTSTFWTVPWIEADDTAPKELGARFVTDVDTATLRPL